MTDTKSGADNALDLDKLDAIEAAANAADQGEGQHIYTHPRDSNNYKANEAWHHIASPDTVRALIALARRAVLPGEVALDHTFDDLAGRGMHELRINELPAYLAAVANNHGARSEEFTTAAQWVASELQRKTTEELVAATAYHDLREKIATHPSEPAVPAVGGELQWHAPGMGEVHSHDHKYMIDCTRDIDDPDQDYIADDDLAKKVCAALNATPAVGGEIVASIAQARAKILSATDCHPNAVETLLGEAFELLDNIGEPINDGDALRQAEQALLNSVPKMAHYAEPVQRHPAALKAVQTAIKGCVAPAGALVAKTDEQQDQAHVMPPFAAPASHVHFDDATIERAALKHVATEFHLISHLIPDYRCTEQFARLKAFAEELASGFREGRNAQANSAESSSTGSAAAPAEQTQAARDVLAERRRQVEQEGWTPEHDDEHGTGQMARAAACYALHTEPVGNVGDYLRFWPWDSRWWKPRDKRRNLVKAAALILADIERLDRATSQAIPTGNGDTDKGEGNA